MKAERAGFRMQGQEQRLVGSEKDPYKPRRKLRGAVRCTLCSAVFHRGRWTWRASPMQRIMAVELRGAYKGELHWRYGRDETTVGVGWSRS